MPLPRYGAGLLALALLPRAVAGQASIPTVPPTVSDSTGTAVPLPGAPIRWWHAAAAVGGVALVSLADKPIHDLAQNHNTSTDLDVAADVQAFGEGAFPAAIGVSILGAGLVAGSPKVAHVGGRVVATVLVSAAFSEVLKDLMGRARPYQGPAETGFRPFSGQASMPSGHTTAAFALATSLSDDIHRPWASVGLYTLAVGTGASRIIRNAHWISDVAAGAVLGITSAKLVNGRWRLFGLRPPAILLGPNQAGLQWDLGPLRGAAVETHH